MFEYVFGIQADMQSQKIVWRVNRTEKHGIENYPYGDMKVSLICESRASENDEPTVTVKCDKPVTVEVIWKNGNKTIQSK